MENHGGPTTERAQDVCPTCQPVQEYDGQERAHRNKFRPLSKQIAKQAGGAGSATRIGARVKPAKVGRHRRLKIKTGAQIGSVRIYYGDRHALIAAGVMPPPTPGESPPAKAATAGQAGGRGRRRGPSPRAAATSPAADAAATAQHHDSNRDASSVSPSQTAEAAEAIMRITAEDIKPRWCGECQDIFRGDGCANVTPHQLFTPRMRIPAVFARPLALCAVIAIAPRSHAGAGPSGCSLPGASTAGLSRRTGVHGHGLQRRGSSGSI